MYSKKVTLFFALLVLLSVPVALSVFAQTPSTNPGELFYCDVRNLFSHSGLIYTIALCLGIYGVFVQYLIQEKTEGLRTLGLALLFSMLPLFYEPFLGSLSNSFSGVWDTSNAAAGTVDKTHDTYGSQASQCFTVRGANITFTPDDPTVAGGL